MACWKHSVAQGKMATVVGAASKQGYTAAHRTTPSRKYGTHEHNGATGHYTEYK